MTEEEEDDPLVGFGFGFVDTETCMEDVRLEMEEEGDEGEDGESCRNDSMNCWIWRFNATCDGIWECAKTGREWSELGPEEKSGRV